MFGITPQGFVRKPKEQILADLYLLAQSEFGADIDLSDFSPMGHFCKMFAESQNELWELFEDYFYQSYIDTAVGVHLDRLGSLAGLSRKSPQKESVDVVFVGEDYTDIPAGFLIQSKSRKQFVTTERAVITSGTVTVSAIALEDGLDSRVTADQLTEIVTPMAGLDSVSNPESSLGGAELESDADYRARIINTIETLSQNNSGSIDYIQTVILNEDDVTTCNVIENPYSVEYNDMPPHSIHVLVGGGSESRVAELIFNLKPAGIETIGEILVNHSHNGVIHPIKFSRPTYTDVYVRVTVYTLPEWDSANVDLIKRKIVQVIGGVDNTVDPPVEYSTQYNQATITAWTLYPALKEITGFSDLDIEFSSDDITYYKTLPVLSGTFARTNTDDIVVNEE